VKNRDGKMVDRYTKVVLTVIAAALVLLVIQSAVASSKAQFNRLNEVLKVQICDAVEGTLRPAERCASLVPASGNRRGWAMAVSGVRPE
jgi:hypothetical protein